MTINLIFTAVDNFVPGKYVATFSPGANTSVAVGIPVLKTEANNDVQFGLELYIPSASYKLGVNKGSTKQATGNITNGLRISHRRCVVV